MLACAGPGGITVPDGVDTDPPTPPATGVTNVVLTPSQVVPNVFQVSWTAPGAGSSWVELGLAAVGERATPEVAITTDVHAVRVTGLKAGRTYRYLPKTRLADGTVLEGPEGELVVPAGPALSPPSLSAPDAEVPTGYLVTSLVEPDGGYVIVLDPDGDLVWWYDTGHVGSPPQDLAPFVPGWDGATIPSTSRFDEASASILVHFTDGNRALDVGTLRRVPLDAMVPQDVVSTRTPMGHHDFVLNSQSRTVAFLAYTTSDVDGTIWASDAVVESEEGVRSEAGGGRRLIWDWFTGFDETPVLFDGLQEAFLVEGLADLEWTHSNSLMFDEDAGAYFVLSKFLDALARIDRTTGELEWVLGGPYSEFTLPGGAPVWTALDDTALWSHGHMSHLWYDPATLTGGFVMFDNGYYHPSQDGLSQGWSRVVEYRFDEVARTVEEVRAYAEPDGGFTALMGDARKLPSGAFLVGWSSLGRVEEIGPDDVVRWRLETPPGTLPGRVSWYPAIFPGL